MGLSFLVTGGFFDDSGEGIVWHVDLARERAEVFTRWTPPAHLRVPRKGFAGGDLASEGTLYVAAHAAVVRIEGARVTGVLHQPSFNDLHHVTVLADRLYIANTGLGAVDIHARDGRFLGSHALLPAWANHWRMSGQDPSDWDAVLEGRWTSEAPAPWTGTRPADGYHDLGQDRHREPFARLKVLDHLHPNHIRVTARQTLVTCLYDGSVRDLRTFEPVLQLPEAHPHDGVLAHGAFWTTCIDGRVYAAPLREERVSGEPRLALEVFSTGHAGWCRGLWTDGRLLAVGLTEVRRGRLPRHRWADRAPEGTETSVLLLDVAERRLLARVDLTDAARHSKLYSLLPWAGT